MAWNVATIKLVPAQQIFSGCDIQPIEINGKVAGYCALYRGAEYQDTSLTNLCSRLWAEATGEVANE